MCLGSGFGCPRGRLTPPDLVAGCVSTPLSCGLACEMAAAASQVAHAAKQPAAARMDGFPSVPRFSSLLEYLELCDVGCSLASATLLDTIAKNESGKWKMFDDGRELSAREIVQEMRFIIAEEEPKRNVDNIFIFIEPVDKVTIKREVADQDGSDVPEREAGIKLAEIDLTGEGWVETVTLDGGSSLPQEVSIALHCERTLYQRTRYHSACVFGRCRSNLRTTSCHCTCVCQPTCTRMWREPSRESLRCRNPRGQHPTGQHPRPSRPPLRHHPPPSRPPLRHPPPSGPPMRHSPPSRPPLRRPPPSRPPVRQSHPRVLMDDSPRPSRPPLRRRGGRNRGGSIPVARRCAARLRVARRCATRVRVARRCATCVRVARRCARRMHGER